MSAASAATGARPTVQPSHDRRWPWVVVWFSASAMVAIDLVVVWEWVSDQPYHYEYWLESTVAGLSFSLVGALLTARVRGNVVGPLMLAVLPLAVAQDGAGVLAYAGLTDRWPDTAIALAGAVFVAAQTATVFVVCLILFLMPDGRPLNRFWRGVTVGVAVLGVASVVSSFLLGPNPLPTKESAEASPLPGFPDGASMLPESLRSTILGANNALMTLAAGSFLVLVVQLLHRLVASTPQERRRTGWAIAGAIAAPMGIALFGWIDIPTVYGGSLLWAVSLSLFPLGILVAVSRGGLYGLGRVVSRTVSYAIVTGLVLATYIAIVTATSSLFGEASTLAVAGATLAAAALVRPALTRVQRGVDRRFDREKVDAQREIDAFGAHLADAVDAGSTAVALLAVTRRTLAPESAGLWTVRR